MPHAASMHALSQLHIFAIISIYTTYYNYNRLHFPTMLFICTFLLLFFVFLLLFFVISIALVF